MCLWSTAPKQRKPPRSLVTIAGAVRLQRRYVRCRDLPGRTFPGWTSGWGSKATSASAPNDSCASAGRVGRLIAPRSICKSCVGCGCRTQRFARCVRCMGVARRWQQESPRPGKLFARPTARWNCPPMARSVNTTSGWREMRLSVFAKRERGKPQSVAAGKNGIYRSQCPGGVCRNLVRAETLGAQWRRSASRLGLKQTAEVTVLADGARWIWKQVERHLPDAQGILDIYHASQHLYQTAGVLHGDGTAATHRWVHIRRGQLLRGGITELIQGTGGRSRQTRSPRKRASLDALTEYFRPHAAHTSYRERLRQGQTIGSGLVESACKTVVGRRLKQTGARWRVRRVERMATLCCLLYGDQWNTYWADKAA